MNSNEKKINCVKSAVDDLMNLSPEKLLEEIQKIPEDHFLNSLVDLYGSDLNFGMSEEDIEN